MEKNNENERCKEFVKEKKECMRLREEIAELAHFIPDSSLIKYIHSFMLAALERYDNFSYKYYVDIKEGRSERTIEEIIADSKEMYNRICNSIESEV